MNDKSLTLNRLCIGQKARISALNSTGSLRRRMLDLGLTKGAAVEVLHKSPAGDPTAYSVRGTVIALRSEDAEKILMTSVM
ncbi:MAG: ferrous iron transport protein A [Clostridiales bacterium]|nr:ferrous iron transport protein A [Clostridiales bacterium]